mmetsp:Transcript_21451/g.33139  ORF Transcript_21451/g.33139 Transcript_21451/m.33139 type:complete len:88 (-) Transcript_21451:353-616(-)
MQVFEENVNETTMMNHTASEKVASDLTLLRAMISQQDRKIQEEVQNRLVSLDSHKMYFEKKFALIDEKAAYHENQVLEREKRLMNHF